MVEPWSNQRWSPFFGVGVGKFKNLPNTTLVGATPTDANLANAMVGVRWYLSDRFVLRADWGIYTAFVSDQRSLEYRATTAGISFFFY
jgi:hemolysin activation/secretion protein